MTGSIRVMDMSRTVADAWRSLWPDGASAAEPLGGLELRIAIELLRSTPRFWSGAILHIWRDERSFGGCDAEIMCMDGFPSHASVGERLWQGIFPLNTYLELNAPHLDEILVGVMWDSPRTWIYEVKYWNRNDLAAASADHDNTRPGR